MSLTKVDWYVLRVKNLYFGSLSDSGGPWGKEKPSYIRCIVRQGKAKQRSSKLTSLFHHLTSVSPKQLCALAHIGCPSKAGTSLKIYRWQMSGNICNTSTVTIYFTHDCQFSYLNSLMFSRKKIWYLFWEFLFQINFVLNWFTYFKFSSQVHWLLSANFLQYVQIFFCWFIVCFDHFLERLKRIEWWNSLKLK